MRIHNRLTWALYNSFGGRKKPGYLSVVVDLKTKTIYPVPLGKEHVKFVAENLLGISEDELSNDTSLAMRIIPSIIEIDGIAGEVKGVLTGVSGVEIGYRVRHLKQDIEKAHGLVIGFIEQGEIPLSEGFKARIEYKYAVK